MQVQCTLGRKEVGHWMGETRYVFKPQANGALVADIENDDHVDGFLKIDGFKVFRTSKVAPEVAAPGNEDQESGDDESELDELRSQYEAKFGKKPHHAMKAASIAAKLAE